MKVWELGEFGLIELIAETVGKATRHDLILGIGDDTAAWRTDKSIQLGTTDILIQNVHFTLDIATWKELGWKALAVNISDIAAMGGTPSFAMVSLGLPPETEVDNVVELYRGMKEIAFEIRRRYRRREYQQSPCSHHRRQFDRKSRCSAHPLRSSAWRPNRCNRLSRAVSSRPQAAEIRAQA